MLALQVIGKKKSGKTTTMIRFIEEATAQQKKLAAFKHTHHSVSMDVTGTDTYRFSAAGASQVGMQQDGGFFWHEQRPMEQVVPLEDAIKDFVRADTEVLLIEGFKSENFPKVLLLRPADQPEDFAHLTDIVATATIYPEKVGGGIIDLTTEAKAKAWFAAWLERSETNG